ncbi:MAG: GDP-mannose 4,6-dehydratase [Elusimicrobia bacterium]|nr:GDP-mannose 4,6-dehydratase [Elusimicrobiota bacterium]
MENLERLKINTNFWRDRNVLVTGAAGFLGSWLTEALIRMDAHVIALVWDKAGHSRFFREKLYQNTIVAEGAVQDYALVERALNEYAVEIVFHLAAQPLVTVANRNPVSTFKTNIEGTWTVLEACRKSPSVRRIVVASSDKAYGELANGHGYAENSSQFNPHFPYDVSKACADLITQSYHQTYNLPVAVTRCGNLFGGGDLNFDRLIPGTIRSALRNEPPLIRSNGRYTRDYLYVKDSVGACLLLAENLHRKQIQGQAFNFSGNNVKPVIEVVQKILHLMGSNLKPKILNTARHEIREQALNCSKAKKTLGWTPVHDFNKALQETIAWYKNFP